eukprot:GEMP01000588.1.p1 GENE.GEMP01000588.1~~GEMP01000588.1.p1  ORF type:complete len:1487 (+),score=350.44 GEMP01000588.1:30-4463(+)
MHQNEPPAIPLPGDLFAAAEGRDELPKIVDPLREHDRKNAFYRWTPHEIRCLMYALDNSCCDVEDSNGAKAVENEGGRMISESDRPSTQVATKLKRCLNHIVASRRNERMRTAIHQVMSGWLQANPTHHSVMDKRHRKQNDTKGTIEGAHRDKNATDRIAFWAPFHVVPISRRYQKDSKSLGYTKTSAQWKESTNTTGKELRTRIRRWQKKLQLPDDFRPHVYATLRSYCSEPNLRSQRSAPSKTNRLTLPMLATPPETDNEDVPNGVDDVYEVFKSLNEPMKNTFLTERQQTSRSWRFQGTTAMDTKNGYVTPAETCGMSSPITARSSSFWNFGENATRTPRSRTPRTHGDPGMDDCLVEEFVWRNSRLATTEALFPSPEAHYFNACHDSKVVPSMPSFLVHRSKNINLGADKVSSVPNFRAMVASMKNLERPMEKLDVSHKYLPPGTVHFLLTQLNSSHMLSSLRSISLAGCKLGANCIDTFSRCLSGALSSLHSLNLSSTRFPSVQQWSILIEALKSTPKLVHLSLGDTMLGIAVQMPCVLLSEYVHDATQLRTLDISHNHFARQGFIALGKAIRKSTSLEELDVSSNSCGGSVDSDLMLSNAGNRQQPPTAQQQPAQARFHPILFFLEALEFAPALKKLALVNCMLDYGADFVLMTALSHQRNKVLRALRLCDNPHGVEGIQCILRLVLSERNPHLRVRVRGAREVKHTNAIPFNIHKPNRNYTIDCTHPQHRALLRMLVTTMGPKDDISSAFTDVTLNRKPYAITSIISRDGITKIPVVCADPPAGVLSFTFATSRFQVLLEKAGGEQWYAQKYLTKIQSETRIELTFFRFTMCEAMLKDLLLERERELFMLAMVDETQMRGCQLRLLAHKKLSGALFTMSCLLPAVNAMDKMALIELPFVLALGDTKCILRKAASYLLLNPQAPDKSYELAMDNEADRKVVESLLILDEWFAERRIAFNLPDLSQHGNSTHFRNTTLSGETYSLSGSLGTGAYGGGLPPRSVRGTLCFDFISPLRAGRDFKCDICPDSTFFGHTQQIHLTMGEQKRRSCISLTMCHGSKREEVLDPETQEPIYNPQYADVRILGADMERCERGLKALRLPPNTPLFGIGICRGDYIVSVNGVSDHGDMLDRMARADDLVFAVKLACSKPGILDIFETYRCPCLTKLTCIGMIAHRIALHARQLKLLLMMTLEECATSPRATMGSPLAIVADGRAVSTDNSTTKEDIEGVWAKPATDFAYMLTQSAKKSSVNNMLARVHLVQLLFNRVLDLDELLSSQVLFSPKLFSICEVYAIRARVGHLRTFSVLECHQDADIRGPDKKKSAPKSRTTEAPSDLYRNLHGNLYTFDLSLYEDRTVFRALLDLREQEKSFAWITNCTFQEKPTHDGLPPPAVMQNWTIPNEWAAQPEKINETGIVTFRYVCNREAEKPVDPNTEKGDVLARWDLAVKYLGWPDFRRERGLIDDETLSSARP